MFAHCHGPVWQVDDFSTCFRQDYLQTLFPALVCATSLLLLIAKICQTAYQSKYRHAYKLLHTLQSPWDFRAPGNDDNYPAAENDATSDSDSDDEFDRNAQLALNPISSQIGRTIIVEADKPRQETLRVVVELLCVAAELAVSIIALGDSRWRLSGDIAAATSLAVWLYVLILAFARVICTRTPRFSFPTLWYHTTALYGFQWLFATLLLRSAILHAPTSQALILMSVNFALVTVLVLVSLSSRVGNRAVEIEYEDDIPPAREPLASVFSIATFSWVDKIVWTGYKKTLELSDVWNLAPQDKAAAVLSDYRQMRKTSALAWHLLKHFRAGLLHQAAWACFSGLLTFAPTLLLRSILQYVENPYEIPRSSAWFFVILLFVAGCSSALADGMALWIGRKTCIRLRSIIVGEIYAKALKRKTGSTNDKVLGKETSSESRETWLQWVKRFGRKKSAEKDADESTPDEDSSQVTSGAIINLMAVDSFKVADISAYLHFLWASTPVQAVIAIVLLYQILGFSSIAGIGMMILLLPVNLYISAKFASAQKKILAATDARIHTTNEVLTNIRIIKYFAWEQRFMASVNDKRVVELANLRVRYILWSLAATIWGGAPLLITFLSFAIYTLVEKKDLIPSVAFTALSLFQILRIPLDQLADMVAHVQESKVSVDRIEEYLSEEDTQKYKQLRHTEESGPVSAIGFERGTFAWASKTVVEQDLASSFRMLDLDFYFKIGKLNVIAGATGSGKTSLIMALLGEMTLLEGSVYLPGAGSREDISRDPETGLTDNVAYCAQQAWLVNDTIKQNVVFASPWNAKRYREVLHACSLERDLEVLDARDETMVGEKGVTLSGGQKQRISLARALYCSAKHVLLDDVLSAVDSHTAKWIFDEALMGPLMKNRTCILVTHNVGLCLPFAEFAVVLDNGRIAASGSATDVMKSGKLSEDMSASAPNSKAPSRISSTVDIPSEAITSTSSKDSDETLGDMNGHMNGNAPSDKHNSPLGGPSKAVQTPGDSELKEGKAEGSVKYAIIAMYLKSMGSWLFWLFAACVFGGQQIASVATNVWIRTWANAYASKRYEDVSRTAPNSALTVSQSMSASGHMFGNNTSQLLPARVVEDIWMRTWQSAFGSNQVDKLTQTSELTDHPGKQGVDAVYYLAVYAGLALFYMAITLAQEFTLFYGSLAASKKIHQSLMQSISHAKFRFFDSTPLGQIMNRFSKDIENVDQEVAPVAIGVIHCLAAIVTIVILISVITPGFLVAGVFISVLYYLIGMFYINSSRDLKRLESVQRSPIYQQFGETMHGMTTIRAYGDERRFIRDNVTRINTHNRPFIYLWAANRWLAFRVDIAGALVSFFAGAFVVLSVGKIDAGAAGLAMTYAVTFTENVLWFVRLYAANEQNMNSVERIKEYLDVDQEAASIVAENRTPANWPSQGAIDFINYSTRYRKDFEPVLRNVTFKIAPCEKVGVIGRTGAGKSSLALALFRALEAEEGKILIDEVDIGLIGLQDLRESIVMVPQDPTLFSGTVRSNLDPFGLFTDEDIYTTLRRVQLIGSNVNTAPPTPSRPSTPAVLSLQSSDQRPASSSKSSNDHPASDSRNTTAVNTPSSQASAAPENKNIFTNLSSPVAESGSNLSQGQRQLLCLARALLKNPKVLLMDEATASIDYATDAKIQVTIRELNENTIITIAHRIRTIIDYDKLVVLDQGRVVEIGEPWDLLRVDQDESQGKKRWFREMCEQSGELELLEREAKKSYRAKRLVDDT
ncbi:MAG: hypothetical protein M1828_001799 [Chrysothrix sp. TS-e1954]|nr:MAG: hypothetical protein M1828_001799 [Chrysothrix sp. TS-e1954]